MARLGDICEIAAGQGAPQGENSYCNCNEGIPFIKAGDLSDLLSGKLETEIQCVNEIVAKQHKLKLYPAGSILFAKSGMSCMKGYVYRTKNPCYIVSHLAIVIPQGIDGEYLKYYFQHNKPNALIKDSAYPSISLQDISNIELTVPSLDIQASIASELNKVNMLISLRKQQLSKLDELVKSRFVEMFGDPVTNPFGWRKLTVQQAIGEKIIDKPLDGNHGGKHPKTSDYVPSGIPFIMANNLVAGKVDLENCVFISRKQADSLDKGFAKDGDVLITHKGTIGRTAILHCSYPYIMLTPQVTYYRPKIGIIPEYLKAYFDTDYFQGIIGNIASVGSTRAYIGITAQQELPLIVPPMEVQEQYAAFVEQIDKSKLAIQQSFDKLETLKKALMQKYFG